MAAADPTLQWLAGSWATLAELASSPTTAVVAYLLLQALAVALIIDAVARARTTQGAIAWAVALLAMPPLSVPLYLLFGQRRFYGYVAARRRGNLQIQATARQAIAKLSREYRVAAPAGSTPRGSSATESWQTLEQLASIPATRANQVQLLIDGEATFDAAKDNAIDALFGFECFFENSPRLFAARFIAAQHYGAITAFIALDKYVDFITSFDGDVAARLSKFFDCYGAFGFQANVNDYNVVFNREDGAIYDFALEAVVFF